MSARRILACLALAALAACATPAPPAPPKADAAAIDKAIRDIVTNWNDLLIARNDSAVAAIYAADAVLMAPGEARIDGRDNIRGFFKGLWGAEPKLVITTGKVIASEAGDMAIEDGAYMLEFTPAGGTTVIDHGKYVVAWQKTADGWKVIRDIFNTDVPPTPPAPAKK